MSLPLDTSTLRTGKDLDTTSIQLVQSAILEETQALLDIEAKLQGLVKEIQSLDTERATLQEKLQFHQALVAPVKKLLPELMYKIFELFIDRDRPSFRRNHAPLVLAHVCYSWRQMTLGYSPLWSHIRFGKYPTPEGLAMWLQQSGSSPLTLNFNLSPYYETTIQSVKELLPLEIPRCRSLTLNAAYYILDRVLPQEISQAEALRDLTIISRETSYYRQATDSERTLICPNVESLKLVDAAFILNGIRPPLNLCHLSIRQDNVDVDSRPAEFIPFAKWEILLRSCRQLQHLDFDLAYVAPQSETFIEAMTNFDCPTLRTLKVTLDRDCSRASLYFMEKLMALNLEYLQVDGRRWSKGNDLHNILRRLIITSISTLRRLTLKEVDFIYSEVLSLLENAQNVERLKISHSSFLHALMPASGPGFTDWLCPQLKHLTITPDHGTDLQLLTLLECRAPPEQSRRRPQAATSSYLTKANIQVDSHSKWRRSPALERLKDLKDRREGLLMIGLDSLFADP